jgi:Ser/Thr protein kinase RdoA (MazF antagonist)
MGRGALLLPCARGRPLRDLLLAGGALPAPERLARLPADIHRACRPVLAGVPELHDLGARRRFDPVVALAAAQMATRLLPSGAGAAARVAEAVINWAEASGTPDEWIVHGDLYENQVLVDGDRLTLIDLDDVGPGDPLLDAANFSAHLLLLATSGTPAAAVIRRYRAELQAASARALDVAVADLAWREAYCLLRLVSGPFRVLHPEWPARMAARLTLATEALSARCPSY